jgi:hypothetical protein
VVQRESDRPLQLVVTVNRYVRHRPSLTPCFLVPGEQLVE